MVSLTNIIFRGCTVNGAYFYPFLTLSCVPLMLVAVTGLLVFTFHDCYLHRQWQGGYVFLVVVCFICKQDYVKSTGLLLMKPIVEKYSMDQGRTYYCF